MPISSENVLIDDDYRQRLTRAKQMTPEERVLEGLRRSDAMFEAAKARLRMELPNATEDEIVCELQVRFDEIRRAESLGFTVVNGRLKMRGDPPTSAPP